MTNKNMTLTVSIVAVILIVSISGWYFMSSSKGGGQTKQDIPDIIKNDVNDNSIGEKKEKNEKKPVVNEEVMIEVPETADKYTIVSGQASYTVVKTFLGKPSQDIVGTSSIVKGQGWLEQTMGKGYIDVLLNFNDFKTSSAQRDSDIAPLFTSKQITLVGEINGLAELKVGKETKIKIPLALTINEIKKDVVFEVTVMLDKDGIITAKGMANIVMSDFGIKSPSLANVFSVGDEVILKFDVKGQKVSKE